MIKVGDVVRCKEGSFDYKRGERYTGNVTQVDVGYDNEDHGGIEICITDSNVYDVGDLEHFVYFGWEQHLEIINKSE